MADLLTNGVKSWQKLNVDSINCETMNCISHTIDDLKVRTIEVDPPETEIKFLNNVSMENNDILNIGTLQATNIIGDIADDIIDVNEINQKDNGFIQINNNTVFTTTSVKLTSVGQNSITAPGCLHLQSDGDTCIYLQADRDNVTETDNPLLLATQDGGLQGMQIGLTTDNELRFIQGAQADAINGFFEFWTQQMTDNGDAPPSFSGGSRLMRLDNDEITSDRNLNLNTNDILNVGTIDPDIIETPVLFNNGLNNLVSIDFTGMDMNTNLNMGGFPIIDASSVESVEYNLRDVNDQRSNYTIGSLAVASNTDTTLTNWTPVLTSSRINVDPVTGIFSPEAGLYSLSYQAVIATNTASTEIGARLVDDLGNTTWLSVVGTSDLFDLETGWEGAQFENLVGYFDGTRTYTIHCKIDSAETMAFQVEMSRIL